MLHLGHQNHQKLSFLYLKTRFLGDENLCFSIGLAGAPGMFFYAFLLCFLSSLNRKLSEQSKLIPLIDKGKMSDLVTAVPENWISSRTMWDPFDLEKWVVGGGSWLFSRSSCSMRASQMSWSGWRAQAHPAASRGCSKQDCGSRQEHDGGGADHPAAVWFKAKLDACKDNHPCLCCMHEECTL